MTGNNIVMEQGWELAPPGDYVIELEVQQITEWIKSDWPRSEVNLSDLDNTQVQDTSLTNIAQLLPISQVLITKTT